VSLLAFFRFRESGLRTTASIQSPAATSPRRARLTTPAPLRILGGCILTV
jgi:hypothetical protein